MMHARDTSARAAAIQLQLYRDAGPARRAQIAVDLSEATRATTLAGIRRRNPELADDEVRAEFLRIVYGITRQAERHRLGG
jgi:hypothetical protein